MQIVEFYTWQWGVKNSEPHLIGQIILEGNELRIQPGNSSQDKEFLEDVLTKPIRAADFQRVDGMRVPKKFLENLFMEYRSPYLFATKVQQVGEEDEKMTLCQYTSAILPLIRAKLSLAHIDRSHAAQHIRYLFKQALYGYDDFGKRYASEAAQQEYERLGKPGRIIEWNGWRQQRRFDAGRRDGIFQWEHVFTMSMFDRSLQASQEEDICVETVNQIVLENYASAWITKKEDQLLNERGKKSDRGTTLADSLKTYKELGIHLVDEAGKRVC